MISYIKREDNSIEKWEVLCDIETLTFLRNEIIENCSTIIRHEYDSHSPLKAEIEGAEIRNFECIKIVCRKTRGNDDSSPYEYTYHITYLEYRYPRLVSLIDRALLGDLSAIFEIDEAIETDKRVYEYKSMIEKSNSNDDKLTRYYIAANKLIDIRMLGYLSGEVVEHIESFFDFSIEPLISKQKIIK